MGVATRCISLPHPSPPPAPVTSKEKERSAVPWPGTDCLVTDVNHVTYLNGKTCPGSSDNLCRLPAANFLVNSAVPCQACLPAARPSQLQAEVIVTGRLDPRPLSILAAPGCLLAARFIYPRLSQLQQHLSCSSIGAGNMSVCHTACCYLVSTALTPQLVLLAEDWMRHAAIAARAVFAPKTLR